MMEDIRPGPSLRFSLEEDRASITAEMVLLARLHSRAFVPVRNTKAAGLTGVNHKGSEQPLLARRLTQ